MAEYYSDSKGYFDKVKNIGSVGGRETRDYNEYIRMGGTPLDSTSANPVDPNRVLQDQKNQQQALFDRQAMEEKGLIDEFQAKISSQPTTSQRYDELKTQGGIQQKQGIVQTAGNQLENLQGTLEALPQTIRDQKRGFDVNANRMKRIIEARSEPLRTGITQQARQYGIMSGNLSNDMAEIGRTLGFEKEDFARQLMPIQQKMTMVSNRLAREMTGWNNIAEKELSIALDSLQAGRALSQAEMARANQLADNQEKYQYESKQLTQQYDLQLRNALATKAGGGGGGGAGSTGITTTPQKSTYSVTPTKKQPLNSFYK